MSQNLALEILSDGRIRFRRGDKKYNDNMIQVLSHLIDDPDVMKDLTEFFKGSEDIELLMGDTIFCG